MKILFQQASRFFLVGILAMTFHFLIAIMFVSFNMHPLLANTLAFLGAFQVSFWGHFSWSFRDSANNHKTTMLRFGIIAVCGYLVNELMLAALLEWTSLLFLPALLIVLFTVAGGTFLLSKYWAFARASQETQKSK